MAKNLGDFFNSIPGTASLKDSDLADIFVYFLTVEDGRDAATITLIGECFKSCDLTPPARLAPYLSEGLRSRPQKFVKVNSGYKLQRHYRDAIRHRYGLESLSVEIVADDNGRFSIDETRLLERVEQLVPTAALSYRQAIVDLRDDGRVSFRGPALELRECLREVLDHVAPDTEVISSENFKLESGRSKPTMKQKVRYALRARGVGKTSAGSAEDSVKGIDAIVGDLTRSVYELGSLSAHVASERSEVRKVKRYIEAVLHDILQIDSQ